MQNIGKVMVDIAISFSPQAKLLLKEMPNITEEEIIQWQKKKGIEIGGGDIVMYLQDKERCL